MNKQFVTYEIALKLKKLGFDEECFAHYCQNNLILKRAILKSSGMLYYHQNNINPNNQYGDRSVTAPLYQQVIDWCIEKYGISIEIGFAKEGSYHGKAEYHIYGIKNHNLLYHCGWWKNLSDARQFGILKAIELIKSKTQ